MLQWKWRNFYDKLLWGKKMELTLFKAVLKVIIYIIISYADEIIIKQKYSFKISL